MCVSVWVVLGVSFTCECVRCEVCVLCEVGVCV